MLRLESYGYLHTKDTPGGLFFSLGSAAVNIENFREENDRLIAEQQHQQTDAENQRAINEYVLKEKKNKVWYWVAAAVGTMLLNLLIDYIKSILH